MSKSVVFSSTRSHNQLVSKTYANPTKEDCKTIYENIKKGLPIFNPKSGLPILYHSPITQKILRTCYKKYKMKKLPDGINPRNLFGNKTPPQVSSASSSSPSSPQGAKTNKQPPPPPQPPSPPTARSPSPPGVAIRSPSPIGVVASLKTYAAKTNKQPPPPPQPPSPPGATTYSSSSPPSNFKKHPSSPLLFSSSSHGSQQSPPGAKIKKQSSSPKYGPPGTPSPPSSLLSSPLPPPSPSAARKKSPARPPSPPAKTTVKKLSFEGVSDKAVDKKKYNSLTIDDCNKVIANCRDVLKQMAHEQKSKKTTRYQIINPKTEKLIYTDSPITKYLLFSCYYNKGIKEVEDVAEIKTLCDKPPAIKITYDSILTKFKDLKLHYTEDKLTKLFEETNLDTKYLAYFKDYITSCKQIEKKQSIVFDTLCKHIKIILNLLHVSNKSTIALYDDKFLEDSRIAGQYYTHLFSTKIVENKLPESYSNLYNYVDIVSNRNDYDIENKTTLMCNYIFNRIYVFSYTNNTIKFCPYDKAHLSINALDNVSTIIKNSSKCVPKYFAHTYQDSTEINNKLNYITAFLTEFASDIVSNMEIIEPDSAVKINELEYKIPNIKQNECYDLAPILYHNPLFNEFKINTPIIGPFNGTVNISTVNLFKYLFRLIDFQTYNIDRGKIQEIESNYKNNGRYPFSKNLNLELSNLIFDHNFILTDAIKQRLTTILTNMQASPKQLDYSKSLFLFHGTSNKLNSDLLTSFLSTTFNIDIAVRYSYKNANPHIYIFRINSNNIKYINFNDGLQQVLLLPGTKIIEQCILKYHNYTFIVCDLEMVDKTYLSNTLNNIQTYTSKYTINDYSLDVKDYTDDYIKVVTYQPASLDFLSPFRNSNYINITDNKKYLTCELLAEASSVNNLFLNLKYTIHQLIINSIYSYFMNDKIINYNILYFNSNITTDNNILIGWSHDNSLKSTLTNPNYKYDYDFLIIDLLCNNFDLLNQLSYLLTTDNKVRKVWFKTTGIFNGVACQTITENDSKDSSKLKAIFEKDINTIIETNAIFKNNREDIKPFVDKYMNLIQQFKTDDILNKIISSYTLFIDNNLNIPHSSEEYTQLKIFIETIQRYFNAKVDYMLSLNKGDLITKINSKMPLTGGKDKELSSDTPKISKKSKQSKSSGKKLNMNTDPTEFDKNGYEITPQYYSSTHTISSSSLKSIKIFTKLNK
jgi:hypothetical protein